MILRVHGVLPARRDRLLHHLIDLGTAGAGEREESLRLPAGVADLPLRERLEEGFGEQHDERLLADDHTGGLLVSEFRVEREPELGEEIDRALQVAHRQIDEDFPRSRCHGFLLGLWVRICPPVSHRISSARRRAAAGTRLLVHVYTTRFVDEYAYGCEKSSPRDRTVRARL